MDALKFLRGFFRNWREVGSIAPSSNFLARRMLRPIDFSRAKLIVEFGPGTGSITKLILRRMRPECKLVVFETSRDFCRILSKIPDERLLIVNDSACSIRKHLNGERPDHIVSGIPLAVVRDEERRVLLEEAAATLQPSGRFIQFQYSLTSLKLLKSVFGRVNTGFTLLNAPPAFVYECRK